jgi:Domain of unknown function (DUF6531)/NHL repeat
MRSAAAMVAAPSLVASVLSAVPPAAAAVAGAAAVTAASVAVAATPAKAATSCGNVLVFPNSVNGGSSSAEASEAASLGCTVTMFSSSAVSGMTQAQMETYFGGFQAIIIGDPSTSACSSTVPADASSYAADWGPAVSGNVAVLGTAPVLGGGTRLLDDAISYAIAGGSGETGLYVSLNCENSASAAGTNVPLLAYVDDGGVQDNGNFTVTGQGGNCPSAAGTANTWQALALTQFNGLTSANLGPWSSPACSVEETLNAWPSQLAGLAYYAGASPATFTASDGATGQAYLVAGAPVSAATAALAPSTGGQVPVSASEGGGSNPAAPGVSQPSTDGVNTENGDYSASSTDLSVPTFGPSLDFTRTYDAQAAQQQTQTGTPGPMGYGWSDNWASSLTTASPVPGDIYTADGMRTNTGDGLVPASSPMAAPGSVIQNGGNTYISDTFGNRIQEIAGTSGTQWGQTMTAGEVYTIAGSQTGKSGVASNGTPAASALLNAPEGLAFDSAGNLFIADSGNNRILEIPVSSGTQFGLSMTAGDVYSIAGHSNSAGHSGDAGPAVSCFLSDPVGINFGHGNEDLYVADAGNNRVQEIYEGGQSWGQSMTSNDIYTVAGNSSGSGGNNGAGGLNAM